MIRATVGCLSCWAGESLYLGVGKSGVEQGKSGVLGCHVGGKNQKKAKVSAGRKKPAEFWEEGPLSEWGRKRRGGVGEGHHHGKKTALRRKTEIPV